MKNEQLLDELENVDNKFIMEAAKYSRKKGRITARRIGTLFLAAVLFGAITITASASENVTWGVNILKFMGFKQNNAEKNAQVVSNGMVHIGVSDTQNVYNEVTKKNETVTLTVEDSVGDTKNAFVKVMSDISVPENYDEAKDYFTCDDNFRLSESKYMNVYKSSGFGWSTKPFVENGKIGFMLDISGCEHLNKCYIEYEISDIWAWHDLGIEDASVETEPEQLLYKGNWNFTWKYDYQVNSKTKDVASMKIFDKENGAYELSTIEITPFGITAYAATNKNVSVDEWEGYAPFAITTVKLKNGTVCNISDGLRLSGEGKGKMDILYRFDCLKEVINPEDVAQVTINGVDIQM